MTKKKTTDAVKVLHHRYIKGSKRRLESLQRQRENLNIAELIYNLRAQAGLSQKQLADLVGTSQSVISRLEDADYNGHSLAMLRKIASAFHQKVQVKFIPETADSM
jgi:ribosome-binding protein aMBF1 (putative translation factor)